ncbi:MAG: 4a-hydroxytetrahydrobiopterin dehydratase [Bacteroidetes bacterium]|nr:4a-hydroxytetrahydrobiopterin dehydratase [Bacteroidota bacterium]
MKRIKLTAAEIEDRLAGLPGWKSGGSFIERTFLFKDFPHAVEFVNKLTVPAEEMQHHPDIHWVYNRLTIRLNTHETGGLTELDFELAKRLNALI